MFRTALALIVLAVSALAGTASAETGPGLSAGAGCFVQCIEKALVDATASGATVNVTTSVAASVTATAKKLAATPTQYAAPGVQGHVSVPGFAKQHTVVLAGLQPETTYQIVVVATDTQGKKSTRVGTFTTLKVQTALPGAPANFGSGLGCAAGCIQKALFTQSRTAPRTATVELRSAIPAQFHVRLRQGQTLMDMTNADLRTAWTPIFGDLMPATTYTVVVRATDAQGHVDERTGTFRTVDAIARVTISKIQVIDDADGGKNKGEIEFAWYWFNGELWPGGGRRKIGSGSTIGAPLAGANRPGVHFAVAAGADTQLAFAVEGNECDRVLTAKCGDLSQATTAGTPSMPSADGGSRHKEQWARAVGVFDLAKVLKGDPLGPWSGTGVAAPAGHDGYLLFQTTSHRLKFRVLVYVDVDHAFPD